jgi:molybdopterin converting factor small subunit
VSPSALAAAEARFGEDFARVVSVSNIWLNGDPVGPDTAVHDDDEVAVIPPVSGG